ncbi:hypothetical protein ACHAO4_001446 [Trichoderma viride]
MSLFDAVVVGAGFAGIYQLYKLRELGLSVKLFEKAPEVGGTWYWNQYPNSASDSPSELYRYSWDKEVLLNYPWPTHIVPQKETQAYLKHMVKRHGLKKHMQFSTELESASFQDSSWILSFSTGETVKTTYLIAATGAFHKANWPEIPGREKFSGEQYHSGIWPEQRDLKGKRVGVIGNGSSGAQILVGLAKQSGAKQIIAFQREAAYVVPNQIGPVSTEYRDNIVNNYDELWKGARNCPLGYGFKPLTTLTFDVSAEEREKVYEAAWNDVMAFSFVYKTFSDVLTNEDANKEVCDFIKRKITKIVEDPGKRARLTPAPNALYAKRPVCCAGYYEIFNQDNVDIVNYHMTPFVGITEKGIQTEDKLHELDVLVYATGFETDGSWATIHISGPNQTLEQHWAEGATSYLGVMEAGFPNFFMVVGPQSAVTNMPPLIEGQVNFITGMISKAESLWKEIEANGKKVILITATQEAEDSYMAECQFLAEGSIYYKDKSFLFADNHTSRHSGKNGRNVLWYFGGLNKYLDKVQEVINGDYRGFTFAS